MLGARWLKCRPNVASEPRNGKGNSRLVPTTLTRSRILGIGFAVVSLAFAACGHSHSTPGPLPMVSATPIPTNSATGLSLPCTNADVAYEPDGGNGNGFHGIQTIQYENSDGHLCASNTTTLPSAVTFASSVGPIAVTADFTGAIALLQNGAGNYTLAQDVFGAAFGSITPAGTPYDLSVPASPAPASCPTPYLISAATSVTLSGTAASGSSPLAFITGPSAGAIVALTSLPNAPPQYGCAIPFSGGNYKITPPTLPRSIVSVSPDSMGLILIARGPSDLLVFGEMPVASGPQYNAESDDTTLGSGATLTGIGNIAFDPADVSRVLVGGTSSGTGNRLTLITGLPGSITKSAGISLPGNINSISIEVSGTYAYVATDAGLFVVGGVGTGQLSIVTPGFVPGSAGGANAIPYTNCNSLPATLTYVAAARITNDGRHLVVLGTQPGTRCASGFNDSVVAIPFSPSSGGTPSPTPLPTATASVSPGSTPIPNPSSFVQNNVIAPPSAADYFLVH